MAIKRNYFRNTQTEPNTGGIFYDLSLTQGSPSTSLNNGGGNTSTYVETHRFLRTVGADIVGTSFPVSVNVGTLTASTDYRYRIERINSAGTIVAESAYSTAVAVTGVNTQTLTLSTTWAAGDSLAVSFEQRRTGGHGGTDFGILTQDASSWVDADFTPDPVSMDVDSTTPASESPSTILNAEPTLHQISGESTTPLTASDVVMDTVPRSWVDVDSTTPLSYTEGNLETEAPLIVFIDNHQPLVLDIKPEGTSNVVQHPSVIDTVTSWGGYRYWMVITPLPFANRVNENPCIMVSDDRVTWIPHPNIVNPLVPNPGEGQFNSDPYILYNPDTDEMWIYYRYTQDSPLIEEIRLVKIATNYSITGPTTVVTGGSGDNLWSPSVIRESATEWVMLSIHSNNEIRRRTSTDGESWSSSTTSSITGLTGVPVQMSSRLVGTRYEAIIQSGSPTDLYFIYSTDGGLNFTSNPDPLTRVRFIHDSFNKLPSAFIVSGGIYYIYQGSHWNTTSAFTNLPRVVAYWTAALDGNILKPIKRIPQPENYPLSFIWQSPSQLKVASYADLDLTGPRTFELWVRRTQSTSSVAYFLTKKDNVDVAGYAFRINHSALSPNNKVVIRVPQFGSYTFDSASYSIGLDVDAHVAITINGTIARLYVNGSFIQQISIVAPTIHSNTPFFIGTDGDGENVVNHQHLNVDEVRVWNDIRTDQEIADNYDQRLVGNEAGLVLLVRPDNYPATTVDNLANPSFPAIGEAFFYNVDPLFPTEEVILNFSIGATSNTPAQSSASILFRDGVPESFLVTDSFTPASESNSTLFINAIPEQLIEGNSITPLSGTTASLGYSSYAADLFVLEVNVSPSDGNSFTFLGRAVQNESLFIDWGDGSPVEEFPRSAEINPSHTYGSSGSYVITIQGHISYIYYVNSPSLAFQLRDLKQWGSSAFFALHGAFQNAELLDVTAHDTPNLTNVTNTSGLASMFNTCKSLVGTAAFENWDVSAIKSMNRMFWKAAQFNQDISRWDTSSLENIAYMFSTTYPLGSQYGNPADNSQFNQDIGQWNTTNLRITNGAFRYSKEFDQNLGNWDVQNLTDASSMFTESPLSTENYDNILIGWDAGTDITGAQDNTILGAENTEYSVRGANARQRLIDRFGWDIRDKGKLVNVEVNSFTPLTSSVATVENVALVFNLTIDSVTPFTESIAEIAVTPAAITLSGSSSSPPSVTSANVEHVAPPTILLETTSTTPASQSQSDIVSKTPISEITANSITPASVSTSTLELFIPDRALEATSTTPGSTTSLVISEYKGWLNRIKITIPAIEVPSDLSNFTVFVNLASIEALSPFWDKVKADGSDIRITSLDLLQEHAREVAVIDTVGKTGQLYFFVSLLSSTVDNEFWLYYNNPAALEPAPDAANGQYNAWYRPKAIYHFAEGAGTQVQDSSINQNHGTLINGVSFIEDFLGTGVRLTAASSQRIALGNKQSLNVGKPWSLGFWMYPIEQHVGGYGNFFDRNGRQSTGIQMYHRTTDQRVGGWHTGISGGEKLSTINSVLWNEWSHIVAEWDGTNLRWYINGVLNATLPLVSLTNTGDDLAFIGSLFNKDTSTYGEFLNAELSHYYFREGVKGLDWINTEYNNSLSQADFYTLGAEESTIGEWTIEATSSTPITQSDSSITFEPPVFDLNADSLTPASDSTSTLEVVAPVFDLDVDSLTPASASASDIETTVPIFDLNTSSITPPSASVSELVFEAPITEVVVNSITPATVSTAEMETTVPIFDLNADSITPLTNTSGEIIFIALKIVDVTSTTPSSISDSTIENTVPVFELNADSITPVSVSEASILFAPARDLDIDSITPFAETVSTLEHIAPVFEVDADSITPLTNTSGEITFIALKSITVDSVTPATESSSTLETTVPVFDLNVDSITPASVSDASLEHVAPVFEIAGTSLTPFSNTSTEIEHTAPIFEITTGQSVTPASVSSGVIETTVPEVEITTDQSVTPASTSGSSIETTVPVFELSGESITPFTVSDAEILNETPIFDLAVNSVTPLTDTTGEIIFIALRSIDAESTTPVSVSDSSIETTVPIFEITLTSVTPGSQSEASISFAAIREIDADSITPASESYSEILFGAPITEIQAHSFTLPSGSISEIETTVPIFELSGISITPSTASDASIEHTAPVFDLSTDSSTPASVSDSTLETTVPIFEITGQSVTPAVVSDSILETTVPIFEVSGQSFTPVTASSSAISNDTPTFELSTSSITPLTDTDGEIIFIRLKVVDVDSVTPLAASAAEIENVVPVFAVDVESLTPLTESVGEIDFISLKTVVVESVTPASISDSTLETAVPIFELSGQSITPLSETSATLQDVDPVSDITVDSVTPASVSDSVIETTVPIFEIDSTSITPLSATTSQLSFVEVRELSAESVTPANESAGEIYFDTVLFEIAIVSSTPETNTDSEITFVVPLFELSADSITPLTESASNLEALVPEFELTSDSITPFTQSTGVLTHVTPQVEIVGSSVTPPAASFVEIETTVPVFEIAADSITPISLSNAEIGITVPIFDLVVESATPFTSTDSTLEFLQGREIEIISITPSSESLGSIEVLAPVFEVNVGSVTPLTSTDSLVVTAEFDLIATSVTPLTVSNALVYSTLVLSTINVWNGTAFVEKIIQKWDGTQWVPVPIKMWSGTNWNDL